MSFGGPGGASSAGKPIPPERGSFPLDHDGECKFVISSYLKCLRSAGGVNDERCRKLAKQYLACRMDRNLMAPDSFDNLGLVFEDERKDDQKNKNPNPNPQPDQSPNPNQNQNQNTSTGKSNGPAT